MDALNNTNNSPVQNAQDAVSQTPVIPPPPPQSKLKKFLNTSSWIILVMFLPLTVLIFLSQNTVPGDFFYPMKRSLENVVLAASSVSPATKAAFRTDLTETRFKEAQKLVLSKSNVTGLNSFIDEVEAAQIEILNLKNETQRAKAQEKLISKITEYQNGLFSLQSKTEQDIPPVPTNSPTPTQTLNQNVSQTPTSKLYPTTKQPFVSSSTPTPVPPTPTPSSTSLLVTSSTSVPTLEPTSTPTQTLTLAPTEIPTQTPSIAPNIETLPSEQIALLEKRKIALSLRETQAALNKIKKDLEKNENRQEIEKREDKEKSFNDRPEKKTTH